MQLGVGASMDVEATVARAAKYGAKRVSIGMMSLPGFVENGYPGRDVRPYRALKVLNSDWRDPFSSAVHAFQASSFPSTIGATIIPIAFPPMW